MATIEPPSQSPYDPPSSDLHGGGTSYNLIKKIENPAIGLMVTAGLGGLFQLVGMVLNSLGIGMMGLQDMIGDMSQEEQLINLFSGALGIVMGIVGIAISILVFYGALRMRKRESWGWGLTASILALFPCTSPCCLLGIPIGIWALIVLLDDEVKRAFPR